MNRLQAVALVVAVLAVGRDGWPLVALAVCSGLSLVLDAFLAAQGDEEPR